MSVKHGRNPPFVDEPVTDDATGALAAPEGEPKDAHEALAREQARHRAQFDVPPLLTSLRAQIDDVDGALASLLRRRVVLVEAVAFVKAVGGIEAHDPKREEDLVQRFSPTPGPAREAYREVIRVCRTHMQQRNGERIAVSVEAPVSSPDGPGDQGAPVERPDRG